MKIIRKKGVDKIRITHNKKLLWIILILIGLLIVVIYFGAKASKDNEKIDDGLSCKTNEDCVASSCCHPDSCVLKEQKPNCTGMMCSAVCSGPLDCGAGSCGCVNNKCEIVVGK